MDIVCDEGAEQNLVGAEQHLTALPGSIAPLQMATHVEYAVTVQNFMSRLLSLSLSLSSN